MSNERRPQYPIDPLFTRRWSPRAFTGEAIPEATLLRFFEAARWAPSAYNAQPWRFVYGRRDTPGWTPIFDSLIEINRSWAVRASVLVAVLSQTQFVPPGKSERQLSTTHSFDAGAAWASLAFEATLAGWHAHGMAGFDRERLRVALAVPVGYAIEAVVAIGRKGEKALLSEALQAREEPNQRLPLAQLISDGRFDFAD